MKRRLFLILSLTILLFSGHALAAETETQSAAPDPDAGLRTALRLADLGYLTVPVDAATQESIDSALEAFYRQNGLSGQDANPARLFEQTASPAPFPGSGLALPETPLFTGAALPYETVRQQLSAGETYAVTDCGTGVVCYLVCERTQGHAVMTPSRDWDASVLTGLLGQRSGFTKRPVVLSVGGDSAAASLQLEQGTDGTTGYGLFFPGGIGGLNGMEDADHAAMLRYATEDS